MNNATAIGYMILAAQAVGVDKDIIDRIAREMYSEMDFVTEEDAEKVYQQS
jgi:hypothetical protein